MRLFIVNLYAQKNKFWYIYIILNNFFFRHKLRFTAAPSNYREWNYELRMMFQQLGLLGLVEGRVGHTLPVEVTHVNLKTHVTQLRLSFIHTCQLQTHVKFKHMFNCNTRHTY